MLSPGFVSLIVMLTTQPSAFPASPARSSQSFSTAPQSASILSVTVTTDIFPFRKNLMPLSIMPSSAILARLWVRKNRMFSSELSAPRSMSSAAALSVAEFVFEYWKQPVSVLTAMYSSAASSFVTFPHRALMTSSTSSPQLERSAARQRFSAKRLLEGWWSIASGIGPSTPAGNSPSLATSTVITVDGKSPSGASQGSTKGL